MNDISDKEKLRDLEIAANNSQIDEKIIFDIYKQIPFSLNTLINAKNVYQTLDDIDARALIYQKYLLSENTKPKLDYLFLLNNLFEKNNIRNVYSKYLSNALKEIGLESIPEEYKEVAQSKILAEEQETLGKVKYNDKILHQSKIIKFYIEGESTKKLKKTWKKF